jgi:hypothetical protein
VFLFLFFSAAPFYVLCRVGDVESSRVLYKQGLGMGVSPHRDFCVRCKANDLQGINSTQGSVDRHHTQHVNRFAATRNRGCLDVLKQLAKAPFTVSERVTVSPRTVAAAEAQGQVAVLQRTVEEQQRR